MTPTAAGRRPRLRGLMLAVLALATILGLSVMHALPMSMSGTSSGVMSTGAMSMGAVSMGAGSMSTRSMSTRSMAAASGHTVVEASAHHDAHVVRQHAGGGVRDCGMDHAGCLATLTATAPADVPPAVTVRAYEPPRLLDARWAADQAPGPPPPDLSELCISRT